MSGLVIDHGDPWWLSPNVWAVPVSNPDEPSPGELSVKTNQQYYLKAQVRNTETFRINNAQVNLYWANPALAITRGNAHLVGNAFVSVDGGQVAEVLCLSPWVPVFVNEGHECLVAEVAVGTPSPADVLDGQNNPRVAQRNLSVILIQGTSFHFAFEVCNLGRKEQVFAVNAQQADHEQLEAVVRLFGHDLKIPTKGSIQKLGFVESPCPDADALTRAVPQIEHLKLGPSECSGYSVVGELEGGAALVHVIQKREDRAVGGLSVIILHREEEQR